jgi:hypothetical protein
MQTSTDPLRAHLARLLDWEEGHVGFDRAVAGIPAELRGTVPPGFQHSAWQLVEHLRLAQQDLLDFCVNSAYTHALTWPDDYWPPNAEPHDDEVWTTTLADVVRDREAVKVFVLDSTVDLLARVPTGTEKQTVLRAVLLVADHAAYHIGQIVTLRRALNCWP